MAEEVRSEGEQHEIGMMGYCRAEEVVLVLEQALEGLLFSLVPGTEAAHQILNLSPQVRKSRPRGPLVA